MNRTTSRTIYAASAGLVLAAALTAPSASAASPKVAPTTVSLAVRTVSVEPQSSVSTTIALPVGGRVVSWIAESATPGIGTSCDAVSGVTTMSLSSSFSCVVTDDGTDPASVKIHLVIATGTETTI